MKKSSSQSKLKPEKTRERVHNKAIEKDIAKAVESIPDLIMKEMAFNKVRAKQEFNVQPLKHAPRDPEKTKRILLWSGVTAFTAIVLAMWIWNAWSVMHDVQKTDSREARLIDDAKDDLNQILNTLTSSEKKESTKSVKEALKESLAPLLATVGTTNTPEASTTSTP